MAINEYMQPVRDTFQQDYVSQYIPLPFREMQNALNIKQKQYDDNEALKATISDQIAKVKAMPGKDSEDRDAILSSYENEMDSLIESVGNDYSKIGPELRTLANKAKVDLTRGNLAKINKTGQYWEDSLKTTDEMMTKGNRIAPLEQRYRQNILGQHNLKGGTLGGSSFMYNLTPTADVQGAFQKYAEPMKADIEEYNRLLNDEKLKISGYNTRDKIKIKQRLANRIKNTVASLAKNDPKLAGYFDYINNAGLSSDELIENLASATGNQFAYKEVTRDLKDVKDRMFDEETGAKKDIGGMYLSINTSIENDGTTKDVTQKDLRDQIVNSDFRIKQLYGDKLPENINPVTLYSDIQKKITKGELTKEEASTLYSELKSRKSAEAQRDYELNSYFNSPRGNAKAKESEEFFTKNGLSQETAKKIFREAEGLGWFSNILTGDTEDAFSPDRLAKMQNLTASEKVELREKFKKDYMNNAYINKYITNLRDEIDDFADKNNLRKNGYEVKTFGNVNIDNKAKTQISPIDRAALNVSTFLENHLDQLVFTNEDGNEEQLSSWISQVKDDLKIDSDDNTKADVSIIPTNLTGNEYGFQVVVTHPKTGEPRKKVVKVADKEFGRSVYKQFSDRLRSIEKPEASDMADIIDAGLRFPEINKLEVNQILKSGKRSDNHLIQIRNPDTGNIETHLVEFVKNDNNTVDVVYSSNGKVIANGPTIDDALIGLNNVVSNEETGN